MGLLALNPGFYNTKVKTADVRAIHETRAATIVTEGTNTLKIGKTVYEIGEGSRDISDKTTSEVSKICAKYNILKYGDTDTALAVALPMRFFLNKGYREGYEEIFKGTHVGMIDGVQKVVNVTNVICYAEGAAVYLRYKKQFEDKIVGIIDIGGNDINGMIYDHGKIIKNSIVPLDLGMIKIERRIKDEINIHKTWNLQDYEIKEVMQDEECKDITGNVIKEHIAKVKNALTEKQWNIEKLPIFFTGGGSKVLSESLEQAFNHALISEDCLYDNVEGLYLVLQNKR